VAHPKVGLVNPTCIKQRICIEFFTSYSLTAPKDVLSSGEKSSVWGLNRSTDPRGMLNNIVILIVVSQNRTLALVT
jgi:hypothetical protein